MHSPTTSSKRAPAFSRFGDCRRTTDPTLERVRKVREREYLFIDTLDDYFGNFHAQMYPTYHELARRNLR